MPDVAVDVARWFGVQNGDVLSEHLAPSTIACGVHPHRECSSGIGTSKVDPGCRLAGTCAIGLGLGVQSKPKPRTKPKPRKPREPHKPKQPAAQRAAAQNPRGPYLLTSQAAALVLYMLLSPPL
jgi:hypothetical protein